MAITGSTGGAFAGSRHAERGPQEVATYCAPRAPSGLRVRVAAAMPLLLRMAANFARNPEEMADESPCGLCRSGNSGCKSSTGSGTAFAEPRPSWLGLGIMNALRACSRAAQGAH